MGITRTGDFRTGGSNLTDARSVNNFDPNRSSDDHVEQMRQKIGTEFTVDKKRETGKKRNELGKDDFMKLMSAQLKYQDPVSPMKNEQMAAQLAQFSALEQMMNVNQNLEKMVAGQKPSEHMIAASLIGKRVTTDISHFMLEKGESPEIKFNLPEDAAGVNVAVVSSKGEIVREFELGGMQKGAQAVRWDGKNSKSQAQPLGEYSYKISASDKQGKSLDLSSSAKGLVTGITFEGGKSLLIVDGKKIPIEQVGEIEGDASAAHAAVPAKTLAPADKQDVSSKDSSITQPAKNNLPPDLSPEKIKSMLAAMGAAPTGETSEASVPEAEVDQKNPMPLWNPANN